MLDLILIIVVLLLIFGGSKLREAGSDLGAVVKGARRMLRGQGKPAPRARAAVPNATQDVAPDVAPDAEFPEVLAQRAPRGGTRHE